MHHKIIPLPSASQEGVEGISCRLNKENYANGKGTAQKKCAADLFLPSHRFPVLPPVILSEGYSQSLRSGIALSGMLPSKMHRILFWPYEVKICNKIFSHGPHSGTSQRSSPISKIQKGLVFCHCRRCPISPAPWSDMNRQIGRGTHLVTQGSIFLSRRSY
jgi:hypothetical protein